MTLKSSSAVANLTGVAAEAAQMAVEAGLIYVSDAEPGIRRQRVGKGFRYLTPENRRLAAAKELKRIASLAIPPVRDRPLVVTVHDTGRGPADP